MLTSNKIVMDNKEKIRFHVQLPKSLKELIEAIAHEDDKSVGAVIRTAAKEYVERRNETNKTK